MNTLRIGRGLLVSVFLTCLVGVLGCSKRERVEDRLALADRHYASRDFEKAKIEYINVLRAQPTNALAVMRVAKILYAQGLVNDAAPWIAWSRQRFPDDLEVRSHFVELLSMVRANETNRMILRREVDELLDRDPANEKAWFAVATSVRDQESANEASRRLAAARAKTGDRAIYKLVEADLLRRRGDTNGCDGLLRAAVALEPTNATVRWTYANFLVTQRRFAEHQAEFKKAAELAPPYSHIRERWGRFLFERGQLDESRAVLDEINAKAPERVGAWVARAELAIAEKKLDVAERSLSRALGLAPGEIDVLRVLAQLRVAQGKPEEAIHELERIIDRRPGSATVLYQLGLAHLLNKDVNRAVSALEQSVQAQPGFANAAMLLAELQLNRGAADRASRLSRDMVTRLPESPQANLMLIRSERAAGRVEEALAAATAARQRFPANADFAFQQGLMLRQVRKLNEARSAFEDAQKLTTNTAPIVEQLVGLDLAANNVEAALQRVQKELQAQPRSVELLVLEAQVHAARKESEAAESALRKAVEINPENPTPYRLLARIFIERGQQDRALGELEQLLKRQPNDPGGLLLMGTLQTELGNFARAREIYERSLKTDANQPVILNNLADLLVNKLDKAEEGYQRAQEARKLAPADPRIADTLGWAAFHRGQYAEAVRLLGEASSKLPDVPEVDYHLGMAHYMMGQEAPAREALRQAVAGTAEYEGKRVAKEYLAMLEVDSGKVDADAVRALEKRTKEAPTDIVAWTRLGSALELTDATDKAREAYEAALKVNPQAVPALGRLAALYVNRLGNPAKGLELARTARGLAPNDPALAYAMGRVSFAAGDQTWAYTLLQDSARQLTNRADVVYDLAWAAYSLGKVDDAVRAMQTVAAAGGESKLAGAAATFVEMASLARNPSTATQAAPRVQQVLAAEPDHGPALFAYGLIAEAQGQFANARTAYERLTGRFPGFLPAQRQLAVLYAEKVGEDAKARELGLKVRQAYPRDEVLSAALGKAMCRGGDFNYAAQLLGEAARTRTNDAGVFYYLGVAYQGLDRKPEARDMLTKALALEPSGAFTTEAKQRLEKLKAP